MTSYREFKTINTFDEYPTIIQGTPKPTVQDRATRLISIWGEIQKKHTKVRVQTLYLRSGDHHEESSAKEEAVRVDAVSHRQLLFAQRMQDMAQRLDTLPGDPGIVLSEATCTPPPSHAASVPQSKFGVDNVRDAVFEGQIQFKIVAHYVCKKRFCRIQETTMDIRCESTIDPRWIGDSEHVSPLSQRTLGKMIRETSSTNSCGQVMVVFCPSGWNENITLPSNVAVVKSTREGKWSWKHAKLNWDVMGYLNAIFTTDCHEERINRSIDGTLFQH